MARGVASVALGLMLMASVAHAQGLPDLVEIPATATALEGRPSVLVSSEEGKTEKRTLGSREAGENRLLVTIVDGKYYWASRGNRPLQIHESGAFTYLSDGPGAYIKLTRIGQRIVYMEHANLFLSTLTYWGELKIITGR